MAPSAISAAQADAMTGIAVFFTAVPVLISALCGGAVIDRLG